MVMRLPVLCFTLCFLAGLATMPPSALSFDTTLPPGTSTRPVAFSALPGWNDDRLEEAFAVFQASCRALLAEEKPLRAGAPTPTALLNTCRSALAVPLGNSDAARGYFETYFEAVEIIPLSDPGFLTGYYEPEVPGSDVQTPEFTAPLLARPDDLVTLPTGETLPGPDFAATSARRMPDGSLTIYPERGAILDGALGARTRPLIWLRDSVEVFLIQVQGSTRVLMADGRVRRFAYDGRNGLPYTSIGKEIVADGHMLLADMTLASLKGWLRQHPADGDAIMRRNRSYVFFKEAPDLPADKGPIGGAGLPLTPWRSIAVDRGIWPYGLPIWIDTALPLADGATETFRRLTIAQDTGSAIIGPARADLFHGSGDDAGTRAGGLRHPMRFVVLLPKESIEQLGAETGGGIAR
jgi:membrane-bound lytic murein transglycosylase A